MSTEKTLPIVLKNLHWSFGERKILDSLDLSIEKGKFYSIIGPNGSGKTTLLKNISRILEPMHSTVFINDIDLTKLKNRDVARMMACVPQTTNIDFEFTVFDVVLMGRSPYVKRFQSESERDISCAKKAMIATNTWNLRDMSINEISGGEKQRVIIARALAQETGIMLLDEPISQLDIHHQIEVMDTLDDMKVSKGITIVSVLHDLNIAAQYSDVIILLSDGRIAAQGKPETVITEENIEKVYSMKVFIIKSPVTGRPHIVPVKSRDARDELIG